MQHIYIFSGLGADERVFKYLDFRGYDTTFIQWIAPLENETLEIYAGRISEKINTPNPILIGLSFGGMIAVEIGKIIQTKKIILIASAKGRKEIPWYFKLSNTSKIAVPTKLMTQSNFVTNWLFGVHSEQDNKLLAAILHDTDPAFMKWAIGQIATWKNKVIPDNITHIHGTADRILPIRFVQPDIIVQGGGHLMTVNKASEINGILKSIL